MSAIPKDEHWRGLAERTGEILNVRQELGTRRRGVAAFADRIGWTLVRPSFLLGFVAIHLLWVALNLPIYPWFKPWDPYPFVFLATVASAEAPFLALLILMHQRRESHINELREELSLQVSLHNEYQLTLILSLIDDIRKDMRIEPREDAKLIESLKHPLDHRRLMETLRAQLRNSPGEDEVTAA